MTPVERFNLEIKKEVINDLFKRLSSTRWPNEPISTGWRYGTNLGYLKRLVDYWENEFDWYQHEAQINKFSHYKAPVFHPDQGQLNIHFIKEEGSGPQPIPLLLLHGWPGSISEFLDIIEPLAHPERFGGDISDSFTVIAPSLPGYGFSDAPLQPIGPKVIADILNRLMTTVLGYNKYVTQGGDWGSIISAHIALDYPRALAALHMNMPPIRPHLGPGSPPLSSEEQDWLKMVRKRRKLETGYQEIQATKPQSIAYGLMDSPVGLAGWIIEKFHAWTNEDTTEPGFTMDQLLVNIMIYWNTGCINTANWLYCGLRQEGSGSLGPGERISQPMGFCLPPNDLTPPPPNSWLRRLGNVQHDTRLQSGGHFTALEKGPELVADMRTFFQNCAR